MRDKLDELRFRLSDWMYSSKNRFERVSNRTKYSALSFLVVLWLAICGFLFYENYTQVVPKDTNVAMAKVDIPTDTLGRAQKLESIGSNAEAFELLATHRNHFADKYDDKQMERLEATLKGLTEGVEDADIAQLYSMKDLVEQQPIYKFTGVVVSVDNDPMYGVTHTVSNNGERTQEQLEVTGLADISVGSQVEFYGVPKFDSVSSPIKVEAYIVPVEQEVVEDDGTK
ncbi:hypothetical protein [Lysinibacillus xylanilyticus]|uniref:hypothetical protein n=1 Tax=Lysinibacillus xylanilyticus TaxID=582475 RepID=UPI0036D9F25C